MKQTVAQLKAEAKALKIPRYSKMRKADLIEAIAAHKEYDQADNSAKCYRATRQRSERRSSTILRHYSGR